MKASVDEQDSPVTNQPEFTSTSPGMERLQQLHQEFFTSNSFQCVAAATNTSGSTDFIVDSGAADHLAPDRTRGWNSVPCTPVEYETASGAILCECYMDATVPELGNLDCSFKCLKGAPTILSMGQICMHSNWSFVWPAKSSNPYFLNSDTEELKTCIVREHVPHLRAQARPLCVMTKREIVEAQRLLESEVITDDPFSVWLQVTRDATHFEKTSEGEGAPAIEKIRRRITFDLTTLQLVSYKTFLAAPKVKGQEGFRRDQNQSSHISSTFPLFRLSRIGCKENWMKVRTSHLPLIHTNSRTRPRIPNAKFAESPNDKRPKHERMLTLKATPHMCIFIRLLQHGQAACVVGHGRNILYCILSLCSGGLNSYIELKYGMFQA